MPINEFHCSQKTKENSYELLNETKLRYWRTFIISLNFLIIHRTTLLNKERSERETQVAQYEIKIKNIEKQHRESLKVVQRSFDDLTKGKTKVDKEMITLKQQLLKQHEALKELGT